MIETGKKQSRVLIVDDQLSNLETLAAILNEKEYVIAGIENGNQALKTARQFAPDIILLDIAMPGMNGFEICQQLKADEQTRDIPVIFISAFNETEDKIKAFAQGGIDYITKPFEIKEVLARVETQLTIRNMHKELEDNNRSLLQEISQRKKAEEKLLLISKVFENTSEGVIITDENLNIIDVNQAYVQLSKYARDEIIGRNLKMMKSDKHDTDFMEEMWKSILNSGEWQGEFWDRNKDGEIYPKWLTINSVNNDHGKRINYIAIFTNISVIKEHESYYQQLAHYDPLTNLPNRTLFQERLNQSVKHIRMNEALMAVLFMDLDNFKNVNDSYGHRIGDKLLIKVAQTLNDCIRSTDIIARLSGDEFIVVIHDIKLKSNINNVIQKILGCFLEPISIDGYSMKITLSIGISFYPTDTNDIEKLIQFADKAMYQAKNKGKNTHHFFDIKEFNNS